MPVPLPLPVPQAASPSARAPRCRSVVVGPSTAAGEALTRAEKQTITARAARRTARCAAVVEGVRGEARRAEKTVMFGVGLRG